MVTGRRWQIREERDQCFNTRESFRICDNRSGVLKRERRLSPPVDVHSRRISLLLNSVDHPNWPYFTAFAQGKGQTPKGALVAIEGEAAVPARPLAAKGGRGSTSTPRTGLRGRAGDLTASDCSECGDDEFTPCPFSREPRRGRIPLFAARGHNG
jgi:hypothetical protein